MSRPSTSSLPASLPATFRRRSRLALRTAAGSVLVLGAVALPSAVAFADTTPTPSVTASPSASDSPTATPSTSASPTASATATATPSATASTPAPSPTATGDDHGSDGQGPVTPVRCVVTVQVNIGAGTAALMSISPSGPSVLFQVAGDAKLLPYSLTRTHPKLPASAGFVGEILDPNSSSPRLLTNMEGGGHPASTHNFPKLPAGCDFSYQTSDSNPTSVVPKGGVAAGYEATGGDSAPVYLAIGGAAALGAAGISYGVWRRRTGATAVR